MGKLDSEGLSLIELIIVISIIAILATAAVPSYVRVLDSANATTAVADLERISREIELHFMSHGSYPKTLAEIGLDQSDPWGRPYQYTPLAGHLPPGGPGGKPGGPGGPAGPGGPGGPGAPGGAIGAARKDRNLFPINADFDLYSMGPDGQSIGPLTADISRDDIIRANNGGYFGVAKDY